jgi:hypothetical protein
MDESPTAFRVIFSGSRIIRLISQYILNPLENGRAITIGPMDEADACEELIGPLNFLGYQLPNLSIPSRVLSLCHGYPSLVTEFGKALIEVNLSELVRDSFPPYKMYDGHIVKALLKLNLKNTLPQMYRSALSTHPQHELIAFTIFFLQKADPNDSSLVSESLKAETILHELSSNHEEFKDTTLEEFTQTLDEMVDLSLLTSSDGAYQLPTERPHELLPQEDEIISLVLEERDEPTLPLTLKSRALSSPFHRPKVLSDKLTMCLSYKNPYLSQTDYPLEDDKLSFKGAFPGVLSFYQQHRIFGKLPESITINGTERLGIMRVKPQILTLALANGLSAIDLTPNSIIAQNDINFLTEFKRKENLNTLRALDQTIIVTIQCDSLDSKERILEYFKALTDLKHFVLVFIHRTDSVPQEGPDSLNLTKWESFDILNLLKTRSIDPSLLSDILKESQGDDNILSELLAHYSQESVKSARII